MVEGTVQHDGKETARGSWLHCVCGQEAERIKLVHLLVFSLSFQCWGKAWGLVLSTVSYVILHLFRQSRQSLPYVLTEQSDLLPGEPRLFQTGNLSETTHSIMTWQWQEPEAAGHLAFMVRKQRDERWCSASFSFAFGPRQRALGYCCPQFGWPCNNFLTDLRILW